MQNLKFNNTYQSGIITYLVLKEKDKFLGICMEFDLEAEGKTLEETKNRIEDYSRAWLENVVQNQLPETLLNRSADKKYWDILKIAKKQAEKRTIVSARVVTKKDFPVLNCSQVYNPQFPFVTVSPN